MPHLVLTRKEGQEIDIDILLGLGINIEILEIHKSYVRVAVDAPTWITVHRKETREKIEAELKRKWPRLPLRVASIIEAFKSALKTPT